ncbi:MAG: asparagine synthase-related protein, partial [Pseudonocardiaceae bacterium]
GLCPITTTQLTELVAGVRTVRELDAVARVLPGCWHLLASLDGVVRVQGSLTGVRRVFHTRIQDVPVAGDRADVLAGLAGAGIDEQALAVRVACGPYAPAPVGERSFWRGVQALAPDHYLRIDPPGTVEELRWWHPPEPQLPLTVGAGAVRQALEGAVAARTPAQGRLSADLSGGMDSTSLCFLAARAGMADLLTFRWAESDVANDDAAFAAHAAAELPLAEHLVLPQDQMPRVFADPDGASDIEAPYCFTRTLARSRHNAELLATSGARTHVAGHGGDELFDTGSVAYLQSLLRRQPLTAIAHLRGYRALRAWPWVATVRCLVRRGDLGAWWHQQARELTTGWPSRRRPDFGWGWPVRAPACLTPAAADATRAALRCRADSAHPLAADQGQHVALATLRAMGPLYRQLSRVFTAAGVRLELPYLDDRVVEAALAVRIHDRSTPWRYKPLLVEAMRGIVPEAIAARNTKAEFSEDVRLGLRRHLPEILEVFADSALATHGLINPDLLRHELLTPQANSMGVHALENLLGCETWLRAALASTASPGRNSVAAIAP